MMDAELCCISITLSQVATPKMNALQSCDLANVRHWLDLEEGGSRALLLLALMVGGDYDTGTEKVGPTKALQFIGHALMGKGDDSELMESVLEMLADPQTLATEASDQAAQCTGVLHIYMQGVGAHSMEGVTAYYLLGEAYLAEAPCASVGAQPA